VKSECSQWLEECIWVFPRMKRYNIECDYNKLPDKALGRVKTKIQIKKTINPEMLLLEGRSETKIKRKIIEEFMIDINERLKHINNATLRKQAVQYIIVHELFHIENKDLITLSKNYSKRKNKKIHKQEFKNTVLEKFNALRQMSNLPTIKSVENMELAMNEIFSRVRQNN
jgi:hypothetical protein